MHCENCGLELTKEWRFCPGCGFRFAGRKDVFTAVFGDMFSKLGREMQPGRSMEKHMEVLDLTPFLRQPGSAGFSVKITRTGRNQPEVSVQTFGNMNRQKIEQQIQRQLGVRPQEEVPQHTGYTRPEPRVTEEPKAAVAQKDGKVAVDIELPGVADRDVEISELENSVEIKAMAGDKAYFKIITKPKNTRLLAHRFEKGKLTVEFSR